MQDRALKAYNYNSWLSWRCNKAESRDASSKNRRGGGSSNGVGIICPPVGIGLLTDLPKTEGGMVTPLPTSLEKKAETPKERLANLVNGINYLLPYKQRESFGNIIQIFF